MASRTCTTEEALERARRLLERCAEAAGERLLERCAFVGVYEDLEPDVPRLSREMFADMRSPVPMLGLFRLGAFVVAHRRRVRKYAATLTTMERDLIMEANQHDLALYCLRA